MAGHAHRTASAVVDGGEHDMVTHVHRRHLTPDRLYDSGTLVAEYERWGDHAANGAVDHRDVGVADASSPDANDDLIMFRVGHLEAVGHHQVLAVVQHASHRFP